ncbi:MAG TPA: hypothetical protein VK879_12880 [Candidatus Sulfomarinibacteraceae bacterium]|nr:hypothetical protein [Candidatus Sulfomarinibacteraceae bacterium]
MERQSPAKARFPLMALGAISLFAALWAGLVRLGWQLPSIPFLPAGHHGAFMVSGFLGTVISLERAVALRQNRLAAAGAGRETGTLFYYLAPLFAGLGGLALLTALPVVVGQSLILLGALGLCVLFVIIYRMQPNAANVTMGLGALAWLAGNLLWLGGRPVAYVVPWWVAFLVLTIAGERLELARVLLWGRRPRLFFIAAVGAFVAGLLLSLLAFGPGLRLAGAGLLLLGLWLLRFDTARRTIRQSGLTRFIAACLLPGYIWLGFGGLLWLYYGGQFLAGPAYDAMLHTIFLGFVFSMIFGHAPVIIPAVLRVRVPYRPVYYVHLALLHLSLVLRVAGDLTVTQGMRQWGGLLNEAAIILFLLVTVSPLPRLLGALGRRLGLAVRPAGDPSLGSG